MGAESKVYDRSKEVIINEWLSETTDTVIKYVVMEKVDGVISRSSLCSTIEEATQLQQQWQQ